VYASGRKGICRKEIDDPDGDLRILMDLVIDKIPAPKGDPNAAPLLQISTLEYSSFLGRMAVGRVQQGTFKTGMTVAQSFMTDNDTDAPKVKTIRIQKILHYDGIQSSPIDEAGPGEIIQIAGLETFDIGDTLSAADKPVSLPRIHIDPPTISMLFTVNTSPLAGKDGGKFLTGNNLAERLERAHMADPALLVEKADGASTFKVSGRGILHLTILVESMRRELYEFTIGSPQVIFQKDENGKLLEPMETFKVEVPSEYSGPIIEELGRRKGEMVDMQTDENNRVSLEYKIPSRGLLGVRAKLLSLSKGYAISQSLFLGFEPYKGDIPARTNGVLIAKEPGAAASYALAKLEDRGTLFIPPATEVYPGMIIGEHNRTTDIIVNATKGKHLTNMRSKASDDNIQLTPYRRMTLEECVTFINDDECVEVTPVALRLRKITLDPHKRKQESKSPVEEDED
jgi:GTP-binding protein